MHIEDHGDNKKDNIVLVGGEVAEIRIRLLRGVGLVVLVGDLLQREDNE